MSDAGIVDWLTNLLGAGGTHGTLRFVESKRRRLKLQTAEIKQPAHLGFRVADQLLVVHGQHPAGQRGPPVIHHVQISPVVATQVLQIVRKGLTFGEELLVGAETGIHGMTARIDEYRVRQDQLDEAQMPEIVGHLINEERTT